MRKNALPRQIRTPARAIAVAAAALLCLAPAWAQTPASGDAVSRNVFGGQRNMANCSRYVGAGDATDRTLEVCTRALNENVSRSEQLGVLVNRGVTYMRRNDGEAALADFDAALAIDPESAEAHVNRGAALVMLHRPGPAVAALTEALSLNVAEPYKAYYNRGAAREALGDMAGALEDYSTALQIHPDWAPAEAEIARFVRERRERLAAALAGQNDSQPR